MNLNRNPDDLAEYLDNLFQSPDLIPLDEADDPLVEVALELAQDTPPHLDTAMRARMLENVQQANKARTAPKRVLHFPAQAALRWAAALAVFILLLSNVAVPTMAASLPGDILYPVKLTVESIELGLAASDDLRADVYIQQAERRIEEAQRLLDMHTAQTQLITQAINNLGHASQLTADDSSTQSQIASIANDTSQLIARIAEENPESADNLYVQLASISPTLEPTVVAMAESRVTLENSPTETATSSPTPTATETTTPSPTPTATETTTPSPTPTATETTTSSPTPTATETTTSSPTLGKTAAPAYEPYVGVVSATANVNIRLLPTTDSEIVQQVAPGTMVMVVGESIDGEWVQVSIGEETAGWIAYTLIVEGTVPQFTLETELLEETPPTPVGAMSSTLADEQTTDTSSSNYSDPSSSSNQGNDDDNKFGCDGQGNSCNSSSSDNNNNGKGNKK